MSLLLLLGGGVEAEAPAARIAVAREFPADDLAVRISDPKTGRTIARWAADEGQDENIIDNLSFSSEMQGGCKESSGQLPRDPRIRWSDLYPYLDKTIYGPGADEVWWGRLDKPEGSEGNQTLVNPQGVGHLAAMEDNEAVTFGGINSDLRAWAGPSVDRRVALIGENFPNQQDPSLNWGSNGPALRFEVQNGWSAPTIPVCEAWFDAGSGIRIGAMLGAWANGNANTEFQLFVSFSDDDLARAGLEASSDYYTATSGQISQSPGVPRRFARLDWLYNVAPAGAEGGQYGVDLQNLKIIGNHGLALQGTWPNVGFTAKQMLEWVVPRFSYLEARAEDVEDDGFVIPHAWFAEEVTLATIVKELTKYGLLDWFVYADKRLQLRFPGSYGRRWVAAPGPAELIEEGEDGTRLWRDIVVAWQDVDGTTKTVGPPGSGATYETSGLEITDPDHPAVRADIVRRDRLVTKTVGDLPSSIKLGENWLAAANELSRSGSCNLSAYVMDDKGVLHPASVVKAGDEVFFPGSGDPSYRRITHVDYQHSERKAACTLDAPPEGLAALQERFGVELQAAGVA